MILFRNLITRMLTIYKLDNKRGKTISEKRSIVLSKNSYENNLFFH